MHLPESKGLDVSRLSAVFSDTTNSYKFYWFLAILDSLRETGQTKLSMQDLSLRMVASVWYPLDYFKLSFGKSDGFKSIATFVSERMQVDHSTNAPELFEQLHTHLAPVSIIQLHNEVRKLLKYVPYRFLRPFFEQELKGILDQYINRNIIELANQSTRAPYRFLDNEIVLNDDWAIYLQQHQAVLQGFIQWHLLKFLQKHNPNVVGLSEKLEKPGVRVLSRANKFWKEYLKSNPYLPCIYSTQIITSDNFSLDHFLPWSYVAHDQLWNIIPTPKSVNSAKSDWLPSVDLYLDQYATLQYKAFQYHAHHSHHQLLEDYTTLFAQSLSSIQEQPYLWFKEQLERIVIPQVQTAKNLGFSYPYVYGGTSSPSVQTNNIITPYCN